MIIAVAACAGPREAVDRRFHRRSRVSMSRHGRNGFTLIELMAVIVVFGILIAITAPSMSGMVRSNRLRGTSSLLVSDLHHGRALANAQRTTYEIRFRTSGYTLVKVSPLQTIVDRAFPTGVTCAATDTATFFSWGLTAPITVTVSGYSRTKTVQLLANGHVNQN
jgi:prepilin-type N-terminal cleavage/methylation domain-containing protein